MTDVQYAEFLSIVSLAGRTNHLLNGIKVPIDTFLNALETLACLLWIKRVESIKSEAVELDDMQHYCSVRTGKYAY